MNHKKGIITQLLFCFLMMMFLAVIGCKTDDETTTYTISGNVTYYSGGDAFEDITVSLTGVGSTETDSAGNYSFTGVTNGTHVLTPSYSNYIFDPVSTVVPIDGANVSHINFSAYYTSLSFDISGTVGGNVQSGVELILSGSSDNTFQQSGTVVTNSDGTYAFKNLSAGTYTIIPSLSGYTFDLEYQDIKITSGDVANVDFTSYLE